MVWRILKKHLSPETGHDRMHAADLFLLRHDPLGRKPWTGEDRCTLFVPGENPAATAGIFVDGRLVTQLPQDRIGVRHQLGC